MDIKDRKTIFISYSWDSTAHRDWVSSLANEIERRHEYHVIWDGYDLDSLVDKNLYMEDSVAKSDITLIVATKNYKERADSRAGGVGVETYLNSARHWENMESSKKANSLVILREKGSVPNYLKGHLYNDFTNDENFEIKVDELLKSISGIPKYKRPAKDRSVDKNDKVYKLTRASEIIGLSSRSRKEIISLSKGTDFSKGKRIKFELWATFVPGANHILALHHGINIQQTLERAADEIIYLGLEINSLTVLRPKDKKKGQESLDSILISKSVKFSGIKFYEMTYKDYIWDYCIDYEFKNIIPPDVVEFYTHQELKDNEDVFDSAVSEVLSKLSELSERSAFLILGGGGIGKTSLCLSLVNKLSQVDSNKNLPVLIRSEDIRKHIEENNLTTISIDNVYDIYELQAKYLKHHNVFDRKTFDLSIASGNLIIVIDGLDELSSLFKDRFNLKLFLESVSQLHDELGESRVILTSRDSSLIDDSDLEELNIKKYELLGFDEISCEKYLKRRFKDFDDTIVIVNKILTRIRESSLLRESRMVILPFLAGAKSRS